MRGTEPNPAFRRFWVGQACSVAAIELGAFAIPVLAVTTLNASPGQVGTLSLALWVPFLVLALPLGVLVDRQRLKPLLLSASLVRGVLAAAIAVSALAGVGSMPLLFALVLGLGVCAVVYEVTFQSFLPSLVPPSGLAAANSRLQATVAAAQVGAPGLGGVLIRLVSAPMALLVPATLSLVAAASFASVRERAVPTDQPARGGFMDDLRVGVGTLLRDRYLAALTGYSAISNLFEEWIVVLLTIYAIRTLDIGVTGLGIALSLGAVGAIVGALMAGAASTRWGVGGTLLRFTMVDCVALACIPLMGPAMPPTVAVAVLAGLWFANGLGTAVTSVLAVTLRQIRTPPGLLGRVNGGGRSISYGAIAIGGLLGGIAGDLVGVRAGLVIGGAGVLLTIVWVGLSPLARIRNVEDVAPTSVDGG